LCGQKNVRLTDGWCPDLAKTRGENQPVHMI
jgi:hypothetical protein